MLYGAVEHWLSGALVNVGDMIGYDMKRMDAQFRNKWRRKIKGATS